jgi:hypothetical protein
MIGFNPHKKNEGGWKMSRHFKYHLIVVAIISLLLCTGIPVLIRAENTPQDPYIAISRWVESTNRQDWTSYIKLYDPESAADIRTFINNPQNKTNHMGIYNIKAAALKEIRPVSNSTVASLTNIKQYQDHYSQIQTFVAGISYTVYQENKYHFNGVNYRLILLGKEPSGWKIVEVGDAPLEILISLGYKFGSPSENKALNLIQKRIRDNSDGATEEPDSSGSQATPAQTQKSPAGAKIQNLQVLDTPATDNNLLPAIKLAPPGAIRVYLTGSGNTVTLDFSTYCKNVLPNEWIASWPAESLQAGAMCVKTYAWYHVIHPKWPDLNADVKDTTADQVYKPDSAHAATSAAYDNVNAVGMLNSAGNIFEAQYLAGTQGSPGNAGSGKVMQWGTKYWCDQGTKNYQQMLRYYYDNSDKSSGAISFFTIDGTPQPTPTPTLTPTDTTTPAPTPTPSITRITVDNDDNNSFFTTGRWSTSSQDGYDGKTYRYAPVGRYAARNFNAIWKLDIPRSGRWKLSVVVRSDSNRATSAKYLLGTAAGRETVYVNQYNATSTLKTIVLGSWNFNPGESQVVLDAQGSSGGTYVIADTVIAEYQQ